MAIYDHGEATQELVLSTAMGQNDAPDAGDAGIDWAAGSEATAEIDRLIAGEEARS
jgi:hypothetical protein